MTNLFLLSRKAYVMRYCFRAPVNFFFDACQMTVESCGLRLFLAENGLIWAALKSNWITAWDFSFSVLSMYAICVKISIMNLCFLKSYTNERTIDRPRYIQSGGSCSANYWQIKYEGVLPYIYLLWSTVNGCFLISANGNRLILSVRTC